MKDHRSMNANLLRDDEKPPTLADYERAAHDHFMLAFAQNVRRRHCPGTEVNEHMAQANRYKAVARRLREARRGQD